MNFELEPNRPITPSPVSWLEFLLDETLLDEHLSNEQSEPPAPQLLAQLLYHAQQFMECVEREFDDDSKRSNGTIAILDYDKPKIATRKSRAITLLALKVASHLGWKLSVLEKCLPVRMLSTLLTELWAVVIAEEPIDIFCLLNNQSSPALSDLHMFILQLYHRFRVRAFVQETFPRRPSKTPNVQVPGLTDPTTLLNSLKEPLQLSPPEADRSLAMLERVAVEAKGWKRPTPGCFGRLREELLVPNNIWALAECEQPEAVICQINYDMGAIYFHKQLYSKARVAFQKVADLIAQVRIDSISDIDKARLKGYCIACEHLQDIPVAPTITVPAEKEFDPKLYENLVTSLMEDNTSFKMDLQYRLAMEDEIHKAIISKADGEEDIKRKNELLFQVQTCNSVRLAMEAQLVSSSYIELLRKGDTDQYNFLFQVTSSALKDCPMEKVLSLKDFLKYLSVVLPTETTFVQRLIASEVCRYLDSADMEGLSQLLTRKLQIRTQEPVTATPTANGDFDESYWERQLLVSFEPVAIKDSLLKLKGSLNKQQIITLSDQWRLPRDLQTYIQSLPIEFEQIYTFILVAKARLCFNMKEYQMGHELLEYTEQLVKDHSYKLAKLVRWELLLADLLHWQADDTVNNLPELTKSVKACVSSLKAEREMRPGAEVLEACAAFLVNQGDSEYLSTFADSTNGCLQFARLLATLAKEVPAIKNARMAARDLWEAVVLMFSNASNQARRASPGPRDGGTGLLDQATFISFIGRIKDQSAISVLQSCLCKIYNMLKDDLTVELSTEYVTMWPSAVQNVSTLDIEAVGQAVTAVLERSLKVNPYQQVWLKTFADFHYAHSRYSQALSFYLQAGAVATDFYASPPSKAVLDDQVYRRMIRCCSNLQSHTQVALLCQFLEEPDYATAFKALQERQISDAMDDYYPLIFDINILEFLVYHHNKKGEIERHDAVMQLLGQLELNGNNPVEILQEVVKSRKLRFFQTMSSQYL